ncbi:vegetative cell wall protein gp1-like [Melia azedarach]|uniref:Vegetative cell wall protein gp1-like n=1 Tax=Melia azedarach TaxID=155640 RepID=A0ACC1YWE9_MELAZ|nr:vegetative cell wall protein gp1-like [Melia azedarach]
MASQQQPTRQWFRLPSIARPVLPTQTPEPRAPMTRTPFRPIGQPQPQPTQAPEPTPAPPTFAGSVSSVPSSPVRRTSVPSSPAPKTPTVPPATTTTSSVPSPPKPQVSAPSASLPSSPSAKPVPSPPKPSTSSMPSPPKPQVSAPSASLPSSPSAKPVPSPPKPSTSSMPTSPAKPVPISPPKPVPATFSVPSSPAKPVPIYPPKLVPTTFSVPTSLAKPVPTSPPKPVPTVVAPSHMPSPTPSLRTLKPVVQTPPQSPKIKPTAPPPSPLILPPPQLQSRTEHEPKIPAETEQKTVLVQKTTEKPKTWLNGTGRHNDFGESHKHSVGHHGKHEVSNEIFGKKEKGHRKKFLSDSDDVGMRVITIAGENKGAFMEVIKSPLKHSFDGNSHTVQQKGNAKTETEWHSFSSSSEEGKSKKKDKSSKQKAMHSPPMDAFMNSNVQGVNNSIVFNSSCSHHDPGVHLSLSRKPFGHGIHVKDKTNGHHYS